jgi:hypothetical protein
VATKKKLEVLFNPDLVEKAMDSAVPYNSQLSVKNETHSLVVTENRGGGANHAGTSEPWNRVLTTLRIFFTGVIVGAFKKSACRGDVLNVLDNLPLNAEGRNAVNSFVCDHPVIRIAVDAIEHHQFGVLGWMESAQRIATRKGKLPEGMFKEDLDPWYSKITDTRSFAAEIVTSFINPLTQIISAQLLSLPGGPSIATFNALAEFQGKIDCPSMRGEIGNSAFEAAIVSAFLCTIENNLEQGDEGGMTAVFAKISPSMVGTILFEKIIEKPRKGAKKFG